MKTAKTLTIKAVDDIVAEHVEPAIRPLKKKVRELLDIEAKCNAECAAVNVTAAEKEADDTWNAAAAGDKAAEKKLETWGGREGYLAMFRRRAELREIARVAACRDANPVMVEVAEAARPGLEAACAAIQKQLSETLTFLGEPAMRSQHPNYFGHRLAALEGFDHRSRSGDGPSWLLQTAGIDHLFVEESK